MDEDWWEMVDDSWPLPGEWHNAVWMGDKMFVKNHHYWSEATGWVDMSSECYTSPTGKPLMPSVSGILYDGYTDFIEQ